MSQTTERIAFQAETRELLNLVIHSLYTHKEIFLRELISNASDALDRLRFASLTNAELLDDESKLGINLAVDEEEGVLCVIDNGIGMSRDEVVDNIGTIARSGSKEFLRALQGGGAEGKKGDEEGEAAGLPELIGQFGVGFYSAFMVADEVVLETRKAGEEKGTRWSSAGEGDYEIEEIDKPSCGTTITLHLAEVEEGDKDFRTEWVLRDVVKRYSDFIEYPIEMEVGEGEDRKSIVLNSRKPLWVRPRAEITDEEYHEFYKHLSHDWNDPLETIHFQAEGTTEYTALLYIPRQRPFDLFDRDQAKSKIQLYVRRVFIMADCEEIAPVWLRFVRGVVDSSDLPLNVSRETLQHNRPVEQIRKRVTRKVLDTFETMLEKEREDYETFWQAFGIVLKEGLYYDDEHRERLSEISLFASSTEEKLTTLPEYVERMPVKQKEIYVLTAPDRATAERSPHLEAFRESGYEVLFLTDPVDEFALQRLEEFGDKKIRQIDKGEIDLDESDDKGEREAKEKDLEPLLEAVRKELSERLESVRFSNRLTDSPACLVAGEKDLSPHMERFLRETGQDVPEHKRVLELNANHPLIERMRGLTENDADFARFSDYCELLLGQALLAEGSQPVDPAKFSKLVCELMMEG